MIERERTIEKGGGRGRERGSLKRRAEAETRTWRVHMGSGSKVEEAIIGPVPEPPAFSSCCRH